MTTRSPRRGGFTMVEILASIAIIALLAAITAAGVVRVRSAQMARNTENTVTKLQVALDQAWKATIEKAQDKKNIPDPIKKGCGNDVDLAAAVYGYMLTRWEFPNTLAESTASVTFNDGSGNTFTLQPRASTKLSSSGANKQEEAAGLLYLILSGKNTGGSTFAAADGMQGAEGVDSTNQFKIYKDAWGTPITFIRYASGGFGGNELNGKPYVNSTLTYQDPLDPPRGTTSQPKLQNSTVKSYMSSMFPSGVTGSATSFDGKNKQPAVISAGANKNWDNIFDEDNVVGYRLRIQGGRGD